MHPARRVAIVGVTGFVGHGLPALLAENGIATTGISRSGQGVVPGVDRWQTPDTLDFSGHHAVINLAGEPINRRWNGNSRRLFHESRVGVTARVVEAIAKLPADQRPKVLINASGVGIYGDRGDEILTESSRPGTDYLAGLCKDWENAALAAESLGVRVVRLRMAVVLGKNGPAFEKLRHLFKLGLGGRLGSGRQWMAWIHLADFHAVILHALAAENLTGQLNVSAPNPERNVDFTRKLAAALHRPAVIPAPRFLLKLVLGEFGGILVTGQRALPEALLESGFEFQFPTLESALADLIDG